MKFLQKIALFGLLLASAMPLNAAAEDDDVNQGFFHSVINKIREYPKISAAVGLGVVALIGAAIFLGIKKPWRKPTGLVPSAESSIRPSSESGHGINSSIGNSSSSSAGKPGCQAANAKVDFASLKALSDAMPDYQKLNVPRGQDDGISQVGSFADYACAGGAGADPGICNQFWNQIGVPGNYKKLDPNWQHRQRVVIDPKGATAFVPDEMRASHPGCSISTATLAAQVDQAFVVVDGQMSTKDKRDGYFMAHAQPVTSFVRPHTKNGQALPMLREGNLDKLDPQSLWCISMSGFMSLVPQKDVDAMTRTFLTAAVQANLTDLYSVAYGLGAFDVEGMNECYFASLANVLKEDAFKNLRVHYNPGKPKHKEKFTEVMKCVGRPANLVECHQDPVQLAIAESEKPGARVGYVNPANDRVTDGSDEIGNSFRLGTHLGEQFQAMMTSMSLASRQHHPKAWNHENIQTVKEVLVAAAAK